MSNKFPCRYYADIQEFDPKQLLISIQLKNIPIECKIAMI
jgi:hypothetical protein